MHLELVHDLLEQVCEVVELLAKVSVDLLGVCLPDRGPPLLGQGGRRAPRPNHGPTTQQAPEPELPDSGARCGRGDWI